jgi:hypothetical protein
VCKELLNPPASLPQPRPCPPLDKLNPRPASDQASEIISQYSNEYCKSLTGDVVSKVRCFVTTCRASGQRCEEFIAIIREGNKAGGFGDPLVKLRVVGLLKDVDTHWSSIFKMIDRFLELYPMHFI